MAERDVVRWYPMRVTYNRELKVKERLDSLEIETYIPMHYQIVVRGGNRRRMLVPAIHNIIFVHSSQANITNLKMTDPTMEPLRYIMHKSHEDKDAPATIVRVPDAQMENFIKATKIEDDSLVYLNYEEYLSKPGKRVLIIDGPFTGVEGVIKRIKKNRQVVVAIDDLAAVMITAVPRSYLKELWTLLLPSVGVGGRFLTIWKSQ